MVYASNVSQHSATVCERYASRYAPRLTVPFSPELAGVSGTFNLRFFLCQRLLKL